MFFVFLLLGFNCFFWSIRAGVRWIIEKGLDPDFPRGIPFPIWLILVFIVISLVLAGVLAFILARLVE